MYFNIEFMVELFKLSTGTLLLLFITGSYESLDNIHINYLNTNKYNQDFNYEIVIEYVP